MWWTELVGEGICGLDGEGSCGVDSERKSRGGLEGRHAEGWRGRTLVSHLTYTLSWCQGLSRTPVPQVCCSKHSSGGSAGLPSSVLLQLSIYHTSVQPGWSCARWSKLSRSFLKQFWALLVALCMSVGSMLNRREPMIFNYFP